MAELKFYADLEQGTDEWKQVKVGKASGSQAIGLTTLARRTTYINDKITEIKTGKLPFVFVNEAMKRGNKEEPHARDLYEVLTGNQVTQVGAVENSDYKYGLLSPDGLIDGEGALEIKCPNSSTHIKTIIGGKIPKTNISQVIWYFVILKDLQWLDFMSYDDRTPETTWFLARVTREELQTQIDDMIESYFLFETGIVKGLKILDENRN